MRNKKRKLKTLIIVVSILACALFLYPMQRVIGGLRGGPIAPGQTAYREDYTCLGIKLNSCPNWPDFGCIFLCSGIITNKTCSIEQYDGVSMNRMPVACVSPYNLVLLRLVGGQDMMDVDSSRWKKAHVTYPKAAKLVTIIGFAVFLVAGCNSPRSTLPAWPVQPEPNFGFVFKLGICSTDQLDSFKGELTQVFVPCNISQGPTDEYLHLVSPLLTIYTRNMSQEGMQHYNHCSYMRC